MRFIRPTLTLAALALAGMLAACGDVGTAPKVNDDPLVTQLNRLANGQGRVLKVRSAEGSHAGLPAGKAEPGDGLQSLMCQPDYGCEPIDRTCYSYCSWFDVDAWIDHADFGFYKTVDLHGALYAYSATADASAGIYFYSIGGCSGNPSVFSSSFLSGSGGPFTLSASRHVEYNGGQFKWAVYTDGWATNQFGREGNESRYTSLCW